MKYYIITYWDCNVMYTASQTAFQSFKNSQSKKQILLSNLK